MHIISPSLDTLKQISVLAQQIELLNNKIEIMSSNIQKIVEAVVPCFDFNAVTHTAPYSPMETDRSNNTTDDGCESTACATNEISKTEEDVTAVSATIEVPETEADVIAVSATNEVSETVVSETAVNETAVSKTAVSETAVSETVGL
jgi:hypothetical protein